MSTSEIFDTDPTTKAGQQYWQNRRAAEEQAEIERLREINANLLEACVLSEASRVHFGTCKICSTDLCPVGHALESKARLATHAAIAKATGAK